MGKSVCNRPGQPERAEEMTQGEAKPHGEPQIGRSEPPNRSIAIMSLLDAHLPVTYADLP